MIPKIIHQIWVGTEPLPDRCAEWVEDFRALHPKWEHRLWGNREMQALGDPVIATGIAEGQPWAYIADRLRFLVLRDYGGVYCDVDAMPIRPLDPLRKEFGRASFVAAISPHGICDVGTLWARRGAPVLDALLALPGVEGLGRRAADLLATRDDVYRASPDYWYSEMLTEQTFIFQFPFRLGSWRAGLRRRGRDRFALLVDDGSGLLTLASTGDKRSALGAAVGVRAFAVDVERRRVERIK